MGCDLWARGSIEWLPSSSSTIRTSQPLIRTFDEEQRCLNRAESSFKDVLTLGGRRSLRLRTSTISIYISAKHYWFVAANSITPFTITPRHEDALGLGDLLLKEPNRPPVAPVKLGPRDTFPNIAS